MVAAAIADPPARLTGCRIDIRSDDADQGDSAHPSDAAER